MARKTASKKSVAASRLAGTTDARSSSRNSHNSSKQKRTVKSVAATILPYLVVAFVLFFALNRLYLMPQRAASSAAAVKRSASTYLARTDVVSHRRVDVACHTKTKSAKGFVDGCHKFGQACGRAVRDNFVTPDDVQQLRAIAEIGMANRSNLGGPTIMDVNTGFVKDGDGLVNIYQPTRNASPIPRFTAEQFALYRRVIEKIRLALMDEFDLEVLYFTAPTFITRLVGNATWRATEIHDEYWHPHVDKDNTQHYDYSGLLYLSDYGDEFTGGLFAFLDTRKVEHVVEPARGRLMMFTAGKENVHQVRKVETGTRYVMSMWFSCDARKRFTTFLDGKMHEHFKRDDA